MKDKCIIVDLDGTLANIEHRRKYLFQDNDWKKFSAEMEFDSVNRWCDEIISRFRSTHKIVIVTGRSFEFNSVTIEWLEQNKISFDEIFFRRKEDYRDDKIVKEEIFNNKIKGKYEVFFVLDDRSKVVEMWRSLGLVCLQCDEGNF